MAITMEEKTKKQQVNEAMQVDSAQNKTTRYADNRKVSFEIKQHIAVLSRCQRLAKRAEYCSVERWSRALRYQRVESRTQQNEQRYRNE